MSTQLPFFTLLGQEVEDQLGAIVRLFEEGKMANLGIGQRRSQGEKSAHGTAHKSGALKL